MVIGIYDAAKDVANVLKEAGKINEYQKILDLIDDLFCKREKIEELNCRIKELENNILVSDTYIFKSNAYYHNTTNDGPFCSRCFDKNKELIRMIPTAVGSNNSYCPECKNKVNITGIANKIQVFRPSTLNRFK